MEHRYNATVYCNEIEIANKTGEDVEELYIWMFVQVNGAVGDIHGTIIDNKTKKIVRTFCKSPIE